MSPTLWCCEHFVRRTLSRSSVIHPFGRIGPPLPDESGQHQIDQTARKHPHPVRQVGTDSERDKDPCNALCVDEDRQCRDQREYVSKDARVYELAVDLDDS